MTPTTRCGSRGTGPVAGWVNTKVFDETGDAEKAQGWSPFVLDTNGNGKRRRLRRANKPADAGKDTRFTGSGPYAVMPHPTDGSIWYTFGVFGGPPRLPALRSEDQALRVLRLPKEAIGIRGGDIDKNGVLWGSGSTGHLISFDRRKCKAPLNGPNATGNHCPEGFALYKYPGPGFEGFEQTPAPRRATTPGSTSTTRSGLGENIPISTANLKTASSRFKDGKMS